MQYEEMSLLWGAGDTNKDAHRNRLSLVGRVHV